jgi:hypothetical protein
MKTRTIGLLLVLAAAIAVAMSLSGTASSDVIPLKVSLKSGQCTQQSDNTLHCTGSLTGLGSQTADVHVTSGFACQNQGGNQPPGQVSAQENGIKPDKNGNATFDVTTGAASCPDHMQPIFTGTAQCPGEAQVDVTQQFANGTKTTTFCIPIKPA